MMDVDFIFVLRDDLASQRNGRAFSTVSLSMLSQRDLRDSGIRCPRRVRLTLISGHALDGMARQFRADCVAKVQKRCATDFPLKDETIGDRRSM